MDIKQFHLANKVDDFLVFCVEILKKLHPDKNLSIEPFYFDDTFDNWPSTGFDYYVCLKLIASLDITITANLAFGIYIGANVFLEYNNPINVSNAPIEITNLFFDKGDLDFSEPPGDVAVLTYGYMLNLT